MPQHQTTMYGDAKQLAAKLLRYPTPESVRNFNRRYPVYGRVLLANVGPERFAQAGLALNDAGRVILLNAEVEMTNPKTSLPPRSAEAFCDSHMSPSPVVFASSTMHVHGYGQRIPPRKVAEEWQNNPGIAGRVEIVRRAPSIMECEISRMPHQGRYTGESSLATVPRQSQKILQLLCAPAPESRHIRWGVRPSSEDVTYEVCLDAASQASIVRTQRIGSALEVGALMGYDANGISSDRFPSKGRVFDLLSQTHFTGDDLIELIADTTMLAPNERTPLYGDIASVVAEYVHNQDASALLPAYTSAILTQRVLEHPHVQPE
ncbi:MAG TPA: hypothetical protein VIM53_01225 [Candidatus Saccharimonadales bacterium]